MTVQLGLAFPPSLQFLPMRGWEKRANPLNTPAVLWVWLQTGGPIAQSNKQSLDTKSESLCAVWKMRCESLLYLCHNDCATWGCYIQRAGGVYICFPTSMQRSLFLWSLIEQKPAPWAWRHKLRCIYNEQISDIHLRDSVFLFLTPHLPLLDSWLKNMYFCFPFRRQWIFIPGSKLDKCSLRWATTPDIFHLIIIYSTKNLWESAGSVLHLLP